MSQTESQSELLLSAQEVLKIANLARIEIKPEAAEDYAMHLSHVLGLMQQLQTIDTTNVTPLYSPHDNPQPLREDEATAKIDRDAYQAIAPATEDDLYLVPKVIE